MIEQRSNKEEALDNRNKVRFVDEMSEILDAFGTEFGVTKTKKKNNNFKTQVEKTC